MTTPNKTEHEDGASLTKTALNGGLSALSMASSGARTGARLAVGTLFAGCNVLLDLGVRVTRKLPLASEGGVLRLKTAEGEIDAIARPAAPPASGPAPIGWWLPDGEEPRTGDEALAQALTAVSRNLYVVDSNGQPAVGLGGRAVVGADTAGADQSFPLRAFAPALHPTQLGDPAFREAYGLRYAYVAGDMANGISSEQMVEAMARSGLLGFFGAAGLSVQRIEEAIDRLQRNLGDLPFGMNLIHNPNEPDQEAAVADLYVRRRVRTVSAAAYLDLTLPLIRYRLHGIHRDADGRVVCPHRVLAKVSRVEVARKFMAPPPPDFVAELVRRGDLTAEQAALAASVPVAGDLTIEADSAGHTDNRPAIALFPTMLALRDEMQARHAYAEPLRVGAAGGIATPTGAAAAFAMGAAYVLTGSINQACVEAGTSAAVREMLAQATQADTMMAPAADMFEMGVKVQVLKWGTLFGVRAKKLYDLYRSHAGLEDIPPAQRALLERDYFRCPLDQAWQQTRAFWQQRDARQIARAERDPKHRMALVFRAYLGQASDWANRGEPSRKADYQVWCGPAMGAFNEWTRGSFLESPQRRDVVTVALNLLLGAAVMTRANWLRQQGVALAPSAAAYRPLERSAIESLLGS